MQIITSKIMVLSLHVQRSTPGTAQDGDLFTGHRPGWRPFHWAPPRMATFSLGTAQDGDLFTGHRPGWRPFHWAPPRMATFSLGTTQAWWRPFHWTPSRMVTFSLGTAQAWWRPFHWAPPRMATFSLDTAQDGDLFTGHRPGWRPFHWTPPRMATFSPGTAQDGDLFTGRHPGWRPFHRAPPRMATFSLDTAQDGDLFTGHRPGWRPFHRAPPRMATFSLDAAQDGDLFTGHRPGWRPIHWTPPRMATFSLGTAQDGDLFTGHRPGWRPFHWAPPRPDGDLFTGHRPGWRPFHWAPPRMATFSPGTAQDGDLFTGHRPGLMATFSLDTVQDGDLFTGHRPGWRPFHWAPPRMATFSLGTDQDGDLFFRAGGIPETHNPMLVMRSPTLSCTLPSNGKLILGYFIAKKKRHASLILTHTPEIWSVILFVTSWPAWRCPNIHAPRWTLLELSHFAITQPRHELFSNEKDCSSLKSVGQDQKAILKRKECPGWTSLLSLHWVSNIPWHTRQRKLKGEQKKIKRVRRKERNWKKEARQKTVMIKFNDMHLHVPLQLAMGARNVHAAQLWPSRVRVYMIHDIVFSLWKRKSLFSLPFTDREPLISTLCRWVLSLPPCFFSAVSSEWQIEIRFWSLARLNHAWKERSSGPRKCCSLDNSRKERHGVRL